MCRDIKFLSESLLNASFYVFNKQAQVKLREKMFTNKKCFDNKVSVLFLMKESHTEGK